MTPNNVSDAVVLPDLLQHLQKDESLKSLTGNGVYDTQQVYEAAINRGATQVIPRQRLCTSQCRDRRVQAIGEKNLEILERFPPTKLGGNQYDVSRDWSSV